MSDEPDPSAYGPANVLARRNLGALVAIGAILSATVGGFAWAGGWLSPHRLGEGEVVDQFQRSNGPHPGFRRNHPKGVCFTGWFDSDGSGQALSKAALFAPGRTPLFGRFAIASGQPYLPDTAGSVRSMAVNFALANGEIWRTGMNGIPVFPAADPAAFYAQLKAGAPDPKTGKPDPAALKAFMAAYPASAAAIAIIRSTPLASGFADDSYNSLNAFLFTNAQGRTTAVRWTMAAQDPFVAAKPDPAQAKRPNFQFDDLAARIAKGPIRYRFVATLAGPGDSTRDSTKAWPADRRKVTLGTMTIDRLEDEQHGACRDVTFDPLILPAGISASDDPILSARSGAYAASYRRRSGEAPPTPAVRYPNGSEGAGR